MGTCRTFLGRTAPTRLVQACRLATGLTVATSITPPRPREGACRSCSPPCSQPEHKEPLMSTTRSEPGCCEEFGRARCGSARLPARPAAVGGAATVTAARPPSLAYPPRRSTASWCCCRCAGLRRAQPPCRTAPRLPRLGPPSRCRRPGCWPRTGSSACTPRWHRVVGDRRPDGRLHEPDCPRTARTSRRWRTPRTPTPASARVGWLNPGRAEPTATPIEAIHSAAACRSQRWPAPAGTGHHLAWTPSVSGHWDDASEAMRRASLAAFVGRRGRATAARRPQRVWSVGVPAGPDGSATPPTVRRTPPTRTLAARSRPRRAPSVPTSGPR